MSIKLRIIFAAVLLVQYGSYARGEDMHHDDGTMSPFSFGWNDAKTGVQRYDVLYRTHIAALEAGVDVSYEGISVADLEIPSNAIGIPLTRYNDFTGVTFNVKNNEKDFFLFVSNKASSPVEVTKNSISKGDFRGTELKKGSYLLVISDENPWVKNRKGYSYGHIRKDILLIENGIAQNHTVMPYDNDNSLPKCDCYIVDKPLVVENVVLNRLSSSTKKTFLCNIVGQNDVRLEGITIRTPENNMTGDSAIRICDCTNVQLYGLTIDGTYSRKDYSGYGVSLNNIWNLTAKNMYAKGNWGVFGTNNINSSLFVDCDINRFDIHCYGRDVTFNNVNFTDLYNQFAGVYGTIVFNGCTFTDFTPIVNGTSYNVYVGYDLIFNNCVFNAVSPKCYLLDLGRIDGISNARPELAGKCWPNITIKNMTVNVSKGVKDIVLINVRKERGVKVKLGYMNFLIMDGIVFNQEDGKNPLTFHGSNIDVILANKVKCKISGLKIMTENADSIMSPSVNQKGLLELNMYDEKGKQLKIR